MRFSLFFIFFIFAGCTAWKPKPPVISPISTCPQIESTPKPKLLSAQLKATSSPDEVEKSHVADLIALTEHITYIHAQIEAQALKVKTD